MDDDDHWTAIGQRIRRMGPPQVPDASVVAQVRELCGGAIGPTVLLGVTPAYAVLGDPLLAFDGAQGMIAAVWPGDSQSRKAAVGDWRHLPVDSGTVRQVLGDGSLNALPDRAVLQQVLAEIRRMIGRDGCGVIRLFVPPEPAETVDEVLDIARHEGMESLNVLRWRLASALAEGPDHRVAVRAILQKAEAGLGDLRSFAASKGLDPDQADHLEGYRQSPAVYLFLPRAAFLAEAAAAGLSAQFHETSGYPGARHCPLVVLRARGRGQNWRDVAFSAEAT